MSLFISAYQNRTTSERITIAGKDASGNATTPEVSSGDQVRIKIGRGGTVVKDIVSGTPLSSNGTNVTRANPATFTIVGTDFATMKPGVYDIEVSIVDSADNNRTKIADEGIFVLHETQSGNLGQPN